MLRIGFDLDGVLCDVDKALLAWIGRIKDEKTRKIVEMWYYRNRKPLLNPRLFLHEDDEGVIITGRPERVKEITEKWCKKFYPEFELHVLCLKDWRNMKLQSWYEYVAKEKVKKIRELGINVYFEDNTEVVKFMRKQGVIVIQYGVTI